jgi:hypothetical protein
MKDPNDLIQNQTSTFQLVEECPQQNALRLTLPPTKPFNYNHPLFLLVCGHFMPVLYNFPAVTLCQFFTIFLLSLDDKLMCSTPSSDKIQNEWCCTSTLPRHLHGVDRKNFTSIHYLNIHETERVIGIHQMNTE